MPRPPSIDVELIRQVMSRVPRPSVPDAAKEIAELAGVPVVTETLIWAHINKHPEWRLAPATPGSGRPVMDYACERALGPILQAHKKGWHWTMLTAYERGRAGMIALTGKTSVKAQAYVDHRIQFGLVTDYTQSSGFYVRPALPWEADAQAYFKAPPPEYARLEMEQALLDPGLLPEVRSYWTDWLAMDRAASGRLEAREP